MVLKEPELDNQLRVNGGFEQLGEHDPGHHWKKGYKQKQHDPAHSVRRDC